MERNASASARYGTAANSSAVVTLSFSISTGKCFSIWFANMSLSPCRTSQCPCGTADPPAASGTARSPSCRRRTVRTGHIPGSPPNAAMFSAITPARHHVRVAHIDGVPVLLSQRGHIEIAKDVQPMVDGDNHHIPVDAQRLPVVRGLLNAGTCRNPTPCSQTMTGFFAERSSDWSRHSGSGSPRWRASIGAGTPFRRRRASRRPSADKRNRS